MGGIQNCKQVSTYGNIMVTVYKAMYSDDKNVVPKQISTYGNIMVTVYTAMYEGGSICNENMPINPKVLYLHAL